MVYQAESYIKKPVEIQAFHFDGTVDCAEAIFEWMEYDRKLYIPQGEWHHLRKPDELTEIPGIAKNTAPAYILINTLEGTFRADVADYIIRGTKGEYYPCKPDIFRNIHMPKGAMVNNFINDSEEEE